MAKLRVSLVIFALRVFTAVAHPSMVPLVVPGAFNEETQAAPPPPTIKLDDAIFTGKIVGQAAHFLGIPFAEAPINGLRFRQPVPLGPYQGNHDATAYGKSCPQQPMNLPSWVDSDLSKILNGVVNTMFDAMTPSDEDCLTLNVVKPSDADQDSKLPVVIWIFGGGFEIGGSASVVYDAKGIIERSIALREPIIYVSMNYRISAFGFLAGKEVKEAGVGNLGLQDQRLAMRWVRKYITQFGGDPDKVTIWGESAGAISTSLHMVTNGGDTEGLFRGAIMQSGGPIPVGDIEHGQQYYDAIVKDTGCHRSNDTLECLRTVPYQTLKRAVDKSPNFFAHQALVLAWLPRVDGIFLKAPPQHLVLQGSVANVPFISGNCDDEGSLFSISTINISTTGQLHDYFKLYMLPEATDPELDLLLRHYPDDLRAGSPFDTGYRNALGPQFKRVAAILGDVVFHGPRRFFMKNRSDKQKTWAFIHKRMKDTPFIGSAHATDLPNSFGNGELRDYMIHFVNNLDPNGKRGLGIPWPQYDVTNPKAIVFQDSAFWPIKLGDDNYRHDALEFIANLSLIHPM
ncbi:carotenoid ester lipase precursor [Artomyces pyxidatus]|uniref:Carotenoid ester lipase n=1 Tax=Artomyces pyxidatus TaxID=48021 RepID=A0ACB8SV34_9AGAM|nr:carotenoid ester lipase precursor [Artomyces pyxidatus]